MLDAYDQQLIELKTSVNSLIDKIEEMNEKVDHLSDHTRTIDILNKDVHELKSFRKAVMERHTKEDSEKSEKKGVMDFLNRHARWVYALITILAAFGLTSNFFQKKDDNTYSEQIAQVMQEIKKLELIQQGNNSSY